MNNNGFSISKHRTKMNLPTIKVNLSNSTDIIQEQIHEFESNKHVQFCQNINILKKTNKSDSHQSQILPTETTNHRKISISIANSLSIPTSRHSSPSSNMTIEQHYYIPSKQIDLSFLEYNSSLTEIYRNKFDEIRQLIPEEFEKFVPILIKLGILIIPNQFFDDDNEQQMTTKQLIERYHLFNLIRKYEENFQYKIYLQHLYGNVLSPNNNQQLLKQTLSYQGQLALIYSCQDQIERELNTKIKFWKTIPMKKFPKSNHSEYSYSTTKSSLFNNSSFQIKEKYIKTNSSIKLNTNLLLKINKNLFKQFLSNQIDEQWRIKFFYFIIEQAFLLLDQISLLSTNTLLNHDIVYDIQQINFVKQFKRWTFLWTTLYT